MHTNAFYGVLNRSWCSTFSVLHNEVMKYSLNISTHIYTSIYIYIFIYMLYVLVRKILSLTICLILWLIPIVRISPIYSEYKITESLIKRLLPWERWSVYQKGFSVYCLLSEKRIYHYSSLDAHTQIHGSSVQ